MSVTVLAMVLLAAAPASSAAGLATPELIAAARDSGELTSSQARATLVQALSQPSSLPERFQSARPWDGTSPLLELRNALRQLPKGHEREHLVGLLSSGCGGVASDLPITHSTAHFEIQYASITGGLDIADYAASLELAWETYTTSFGHAAPPSYPPNPAPGDRYHVRIDELGAGLLGFVTDFGDHAGSVGDNPATAWDDEDAAASCMVLTSDYTGVGTPPLKVLQATVAHELHHAVQYGYGALDGTNVPDESFVEGTATLLEDEVFDDADDNYLFLWPDFTRCMGQYVGSPYEYWVVFRALLEHFGSGLPGGAEEIVQSFWEAIGKNEGEQLSAFGTALETTGGEGLGSAYHEAAIALKFLLPCGADVAPGQCLEEGPAYALAAAANPVHASVTSLPGMHAGSLADHYSLNWIELPRGPEALSVSLENTSVDGQLRLSVGCATSDALAVSHAAGAAAGGETIEIAYVDASECDELVAIITNGAQTEANPRRCHAADYRLGLETSSVTPGPILLRARKAGAGPSDVELSWSGGAPFYQVSRAVSPDALVRLDSSARPSFSDAGALPAPASYYYSVD